MINNSIKIISSLLPFILFSALLYSQPVSDGDFGGNVIPPLPNAAALAEYSEIPVSMYTGIPSINIPLGSLAAKDISTSVSLGYHGGGLKLNERASWVGLGWSLKAGGLISRTVKGTPDFYNTNYSYPFSMNNADIENSPNEGLSFFYQTGAINFGAQSGYPAWSSIHQVYNPETQEESMLVVEPVANSGCPQESGNAYQIGSTESCVDPINPVPVLNAMSTNSLNLLLEQIGTYDTEPDIFNFSIDGYSGQFIFDKSGVPILLEHQDLAIEVDSFIGGGATAKWTIVTPDGSKYLFSTAEYSDDVYGCEVLSGGGNEFQSVSSWYLDKVISPTGNEIRYVYEDYTMDAYQLSLTKTKKIRLVTAPGGDPNSNSNNNTDESCAPVRRNIHAKRLVSIENDFGDVVNFSESNIERIDQLGDYPLEEVKFMKGGSVLKSYGFGYGNFDCPTNEGKRLKLLSITEKNGNGVEKPPHKFDYIPGVLPDYFSFALDYWGFYNGKTGNDTPIPSYLMKLDLPSGGGMSPTGYTFVDFKGADRSPDFTYTKIGSLSSIEYPTGSVTEFDFEQHEFRDYSAIPDNYVATENTYEAKVDITDGVGATDSSQDFTISLLSLKPVEIELARVSLEIKIGCIENGNGIISEYPEGYLNGDLPTNGCTNWVAVIDATTGTEVKRFLVPDEGDIDTVIETYLEAGTYRLEAGGLNGSGTANDNYASIKLTYQQEDFSQPLLEQPTGGLRIRAINTFESISALEPLTREFLYDNPLTDLSSGRIIIPAVGFKDVRPGTGQTKVPHLMLSGTSHIPLSSTQGSHVGYTHVTEKSGGTSIEEGYTVNEFSFQNDGFNGAEGMKFPYAPPINNDIYRGNLLSTKVYDFRDSLVSETTNIYDYTVKSTAEGMSVGTIFRYWDTHSAIYFQKYSIGSVWKKITATTTTTYDNAGVGLTTAQSFLYASHGLHTQPIKITSTGYNGIIHTTETTYAHDIVSNMPPLTNTLDGASVALEDLVEKNIHVPVEMKQYINIASPLRKLVSGNLTVFEKSNITGFTLPKEIHRVETDNPIPTSTFVDSHIDVNGHFIKDQSYTIQGTINAYADNGNIIEYQKTHHNPISYIWNADGLLPIAKIANARADQVFYTSFETNLDGTMDANGNWQVSGTDWVPSSSKTGNHHYNITPGNSISAIVPNAGIYKLSFWHKGAIAKVMKGSGQHDQTLSKSGWTYYNTEVYLAENGMISIEGTNNNTFIDELRLHPINALMETYCYDENTKQIITSNTSNNIASHYEYDDFLRLEYVRDKDGNIIMNYGYEYHDQNTYGKNKVTVKTVLTDGLTNTSSFDTDFADLLSHEKMESIQYIDGLGRTEQQIAVKQSISGKDIVSFNEYDALGRENKQFLPFTIGNGNDGAFVPNARTLQEGWYSTNPNNTPNNKMIAETTTAFSETYFEASPLSRVEEQGASGLDWQIGSGHTMRMEYGNINPQLNIPTLLPMHKVYDFQSGNGGNYNVRELSYIVSIDENNNKIISYTDKQGRSILVRRIMGNHLTDKADTYNIYNDFGLLEAVVPPEAVEYMESSGNWDYTDRTIFGGWCYYYEYDHRLRLKSKRLPGKTEESPNDGETRYFYDDRDQLVLTQDPNQQSTTPQTGSFTKYDQFGRPIQTGIYTIPTGGDIEATIASAGSTYETHTSSFSNGYTNQAFPSLDKVYYTHTFYDDYDFNNDNTDDVDYIQGQGNGISLPANHFDRLDGQLTATKIRYEEDGLVNWLTTAIFYDDRMRTIQIRSQHHLGYWDTNSTSYDFGGKVLTTKRRHQDSSGQYTSYLEKFDYYGNGSLENVRYKARYDGEYIRSNHKYNELGQLMEKNLHANAAGTNFLQSIDYRYNIRGWLESINDTYAPSSTENVYSSINGGTYTISLSNVGVIDMDFIIGKSMESLPVGEAVPVNVVESNVVTVGIPRDVPSMNTITINLDGIADVNGYADIPNAVNALESAIFSALAAEGMEGYIVLAIANELKEMAKATWYLVEDSHDLDDNDLYSQRLYYNRANFSLGATTGTPQYNGNVSSTVWHVAGKEKRQMYAFEYDNLDRLIKADYGTINVTNGYIQGSRYSVPKISYDLNGNILNLKRRGMDTSPNAPTPSMVIDDLTYTYDQKSNRLLGVHDAKVINEGFTEIDTTIIVDYDYDASGNMIVDRNKNLEIEYNHLNLPIHFGWNNDGNGNFDKEIRILYDAAGVKLRKTVIDSAILVSTKDYVGGIEYKDGNLEAVYHSEGRCVPRSDYAEYTVNNSYLTTTGAFVYEYTIKDHLGNARLTFADLDKDGNITVSHTNPLETEIIQENHYYPFGMQHEQPTTQVGTPNDYTYNGKELNDDFGLNLHDYGARWYDASIGRWHSVDPLAEKYNSMSPYNYVANNPLKYIDPDGKQIIIRMVDTSGDQKKEFNVAFREGKFYMADNPEVEYTENVQFLTDIKDAYSYISESEDAKAIFDAIASDDKNVVELQEIKHLMSDRAVVSEIGWSPISGLAAEAGDQTPAMGLLHELGHVFLKLNPEVMENYKGGTEDDWIFEFVEKLLNEPQRDGHGDGFPYATDGPNSTKEESKSSRKERKAKRKEEQKKGTTNKLYKS